MSQFVYQRVASLSAWHRIKSSHHRGKEVTAIVVRVYAHALICRVGSYKGSPAIIRRSELSWKRGEQETSGYCEGDSIEAVVVEYGDDHRELVLSKKRADVRLEDAFPVGSEFAGTIVDMPSWGFTVHLAGGVDGFLLPAEAPDESDLPSSIRLQVGDKVMVEVIGYDGQRGNPRLSMIRAIASHQDTIRKEIEVLASGASTPPLDEKVVPKLGAGVKSMNILVLDDEETVIDGLNDLLLSEGHQVVAARSTQETLGLLKNAPPLDAALLDIQLDFESIRQADLPISIREKFSGCRVYLFTGNESVLDTEDLRNLNDHIHGVIPKGWSPQEILDVLHRRARAVSVDKLMRSLPRRDSNRAAKRVGASARSLLKQAIDCRFDSLGKLWPGSRPLIVEYDRVTTRLHVLKAPGFPPQALNALGRGFMDSELGDVLRDNTPLKISVSDRPHPFVRELFDKLEADHVLAAPVKVEGYLRQVAVFSFGPPGETDIPKGLSNDLDHALSTMALEIEKSLLQSRIFRFQKAAGAGSLVLGMTHEIRNLMSPVRTEIEAVRNVLKNPSRMAALPDDFIGSAVERMSDAAAAVQSLMDGFLGMTKLNEEEALPLIYLLQEVVQLCRDSARQQEVFLRLDYSGREAMASKMPSSVRQVFMNVILNAIQHVAQTDVKHKLVSITARPVNSEGRLRIDITDNGYGVAMSQRETMFEMFATTRSNGTGLGLFVAREIVSQAGGEIRMKTDCSRYRNNTISVFLPNSEPTLS